MQECISCQSANSAKGRSAQPTRPDLPGRPWNVVQMDTLELGSDKSGTYHCVLVCVDTFTKWVEVVPLRRHDASCVAKAFVQLCCRWGPPQIVRTDNGTEFVNAVVEAVFQKFGVQMRTGAVRHPQSQGGVERVNRTILTLLRKVLDEASDWRTELDIALYCYRVRSHTTTKVSPFVAMTGWQPRDLVVEAEVDEYSPSEWSDHLAKKSAKIRDLVEAELSSTDVEDCNMEAECAYSVGQEVMLLKPSRRQKLQSPYEPGWTVIKVIAPSTVVIGNHGREKVVNVDLIKRCRGTVDDVPVPDDGLYPDASAEELIDSDIGWSPTIALPPAAPVDTADADDAEAVAVDALPEFEADEMADAGTGGLRSRDTLRLPAKFGDYYMPKIGHRRYGRQGEWCNGKYGIMVTPLLASHCLCI